MSLNKTYIALGTNVGNWKNNFNNAVRLISNVGIITQFASIYLSHPFGYEKQHYYYNSALELKTNLSPYGLFNALQMIEKKLQKNKLFINGPRKIDLDIIFSDQKVFKNNNLIIPHPRAQERDFVLYPLLDINPFFRHPVAKLTVKELIEQLKDTYIVKKLSYRNLL